MYALQGVKGEALLPDLRMTEPRDPRINVDQEGRHLLKFGTPIWNIGAGRMKDEG